MKNIPSLLALHSIDGLGPIRLRVVLDYFKDPKLAWETDPKQLLEIGIPRNTVELLVEMRKKLEPETYAESIKNSGIKWMTIFDENYPKSLKEIYDPPIVLYYQGEVLPQDQRAIAVVGTRKMTGYGKTITEEFTKFLVKSGLTIVSGLARGVDAHSHKTAINNKGRTIAVLGGGLKNIYPPENISLASDITNGFGALVSEFPPDKPSLPGNFPARNRIISGLSQAVLVTEAASDSGSLITARIAIEQGRDVFAIPGPITSQLSQGPIDLIKEGAKVVSKVEDILDELGIEKNHRSNIKDQNNLDLSEDEKLVLKTIENENMHIDEICRKLNLSAAYVSGTLLKLEILGAVKNLGLGIYCRG